MAAAVALLAMKKIIIQCCDDAMRKFLKKYKVIFNGLLGLLFIQPIFWELFKHGAMGRDMTDEWRLGVLLALDVVAFAWFWHCLSPDKSAVKPKWW